MIDIFIKSYNRPYYLDRCLASIYKYITCCDFNIIILDDGTPSKYLHKIEANYPEVTIKKSSFYEDKVVYTSLGKAPKNKSVPIDFWINSIKKSTDYFLLLEDDIWFTKFTKLSEIVTSMKTNDGVLTKLFWLNNINLTQGKKYYKKENLTYITPKIPFKSPCLYWLFFKIDRFKIHKTSKLLKIYTPKKNNSYYTLYSVAGVVFKKDYFLNLWKNHKNIVDEKLQVFNSLKYIRQNKKVTFSITNDEVVKTGFVSSATNKSYYKSNFDMFHFNAFINQLWFDGQFEVMQNFPKDFSSEYITTLINTNGVDFTAKQWSNWSNLFKTEFQSFGCILD